MNLTLPPEAFRLLDEMGVLEGCEHRIGKYTQEHYGPSLGDRHPDCPGKVLPLSRVRELAEMLKSRGVP